VSARIAEIGVKTRKIWLKQGSRGFFLEETELLGARSKKPGASMKLNLNIRG